MNIILIISMFLTGSYLLYLLVRMSRRKPKEKVFFEHTKNTGEWSTIEQQIALEINFYRQEKGLGHIFHDKFLREQAQIRTDYCISVQHITHDYYGIILGNAKKKGLKTVGEILAYGHRTAGAVTDSWIDSGSHRKIMEREDWKYIGVSVRQDEMGRNYFCCVFGK